MSYCMQVGDECWFRCGVDHIVWLSFRVYPLACRGYYAGLVGLIGISLRPWDVCVVALTPIVGWRVIYVLLGVMGLIALVSTVRFFRSHPRWLASCGKAAEADDVVRNREEFS